MTVAWNDLLACLDEGGTFATLAIQARQSRGIIAAALVSLTAEGTLVASYAQEALLRFR